jgi:hypothetical protein
LVKIFEWIKWYRVKIVTPRKILLLEEMFHSIKTCKSLWS